MSLPENEVGTKLPGHLIITPVYRIIAAHRPCRPKVFNADRI
jgi:hypothetical protein